MSLVSQFVGSPLLLLLSITLFVCASIATFDMRIIQAKRSGDLPPDYPNLPGWVGVVHLLDWALWLAILIINWRIGLLVWVVLFVLKVLPVLETIGNNLMSPFKVVSGHDDDRIL